MHHTFPAAISFSVLFALGALPGQKPAPSQPAAGPEAVSDADFQRQNQAWQQFVQQHEGTWHSHWCAATGTPSAIFGEGLPLADWRGNTMAEARRHATQLLQDQQALLGLGSSEFREIIGARMGRTWSFVYDQYFRGLPVIGGRADVRVHMLGSVSMFGSSAWPIPATFVTVPRLGDLHATQIAWQALGAEATQAPQPGVARGAQLVIWGDIEARGPAPFFLAWEVPISAIDAEGKGPLGRSYVDANTGAVLHYTSDKHECGLAGCRHPHHGARRTGAEPSAPVNTLVTVMGWTRTGLDAGSPLVNVAQPGLVFNVPGIGNVTADNNGQFTINIAAPVSITLGQLDGRHHALMSGSSAPSGSVTVNPGVPTTIQLLTAGATANQAAHTTTSWWTDRTNELCRSILGNTAELNTASNVVPTVNIAQTCNAWYGNNTINFYVAGGGCTNTATSTIVAHEWGHGLDDRYGGISQQNGLSEGWGDTLAMYLVDDSRVGSGFQTPNVGLRDGTNTRQYPGGSGVHEQGESWMGFAWKLRERLATTLGNRPTAIAITNDIVLGSIVADAVNQQDAVLQVFLADDDDSNLNNGTPHSVDLIWACNQHSLPFPNQPGLPNDECTGAILLQNGLNGPFASTGASTSSPGWPCANGGNDVWFRYLSGGNGTLNVSTCGQAAFDTAVQIFSGTCAGLSSVGCLDDSCSLQTSLSVAVTAGTYYIRVGGYQGATGSFQLNVSGPAGVPAATAPYGTGCYRTSRAFYELGAAAAFDLNNTSMRLQRNGNFYIAQSGGGYVAPTGTATVLALGDDAAVSVPLTGAFPYPGGSTTSLEVCSNGFVSVATGNGAGYTPSAASWLAGPQPRFGSWHDFNPASGTGRVKFQQIGTTAYVTWDGVVSFGTTTPNTWQLQFDLLTGNVTYAWQTMSGLGNSVLVGCAMAAPNNDLGSLDISAALPGTFRTNAENLEALALAGTLPTLGATVTLTTTNYPAVSGLGVQVISLVRHDPGIDLTPLGLPGCLRFTGVESMVVVVPVGGQSTYLLNIPNNPAYMNLPLNAQTYAFAPGANPVGVIASNGVAMTVGI